MATTTSSGAGPAEPGAGGTLLLDEAPRRPADPARLRHVAALDGVRGLAVLAVVLFHFGVPGFDGGFLGVSVFFTLSGFLITNLLLSEGDHHNGVSLRRFWSRRARRLLPALGGCLVLVLAFAAFAADADQLRKLPGDVASTLAYVTNWHFILSGDPYSAGYQQPSPLQHAWSLAIEEQFYVLFPLLATALVARAASRGRWAAALGILLAYSMAATLLLFDPSDVTRVYYGTGTRAFEILAGALLAVAVRTEVPDGIRRLPGRAVWSFVPLVALGTLVVVTSTASEWLYRGGLWLVALCSVGLVLGALDDGPLARVLRWGPLATLGIVSYGVYLYHWPLTLWLSPAHTGLDGVALFGVRVAATAALTALSFFVLERPIRGGARLPRPALAVGLPVFAVAVLLVSVQLAGRADDRAVVDVDLALSSTTAVPAAADAGGPGTTAAPVAPPRRVLFLGDSLVHQSWPGLSGYLAGQGVTTEAIGGPSQNLLANRIDWMAELGSAVGRFDPDVVVIESCCGFGDPRKDTAYTAPDGRVVPLDSPELYAEWRAAAVQATTLASARGAVVLWVLAPPAHTSGYYGPIEPRIALVNAVHASLAACDARVGVVDWRALAAPDGSYTDTLPDAEGNPVTIRAADGLHFTPEGVGALSKLTLDAIESQWDAIGGRGEAVPATALAC